jgi:protein involved in plasmid replication-relaxation
MSTGTAAKRSQSSLFPLSGTQLAIVRAVGIFRVMSALDVLYRLFSPTSLTNVRRLLSDLSGGDEMVGHWLYRWSLPSRTKGTKTRIYALGAKGARVLAQEGYHTRPYTLARLSYGYLYHSLFLTRLVCAATYWCRTQQAYFLSREALSYELAQNPPRVTLQEEGNPRTLSVVPDAFLCFERRDGGQFPLLVEIDRGTEHQSQFKNYLKGRIALIKSGTYSAIFGEGSVVVAYVIPCEDADWGESRRDRLRGWTQELIEEMIAEEHREGWLRIFRFCSLPETIYDQTATLFEKASWFIPGSLDPVPLFDQSHPTSKGETPCP